MRRFLAQAVCCVLAFVGAFSQQQPQQTKATPQTFHISGVLVNAISDEPIPGVELLIASTANRSEVHAVGSSEDGRFDFANVAPGKYALAAAVRGFGFQVLDQHEQAFSTAIATGPGLDSKNVVFHLKPQGSIHGRITDDYGEAVRNAQVLLFYDGLQAGRRGAHFISQVNTDDQGDYLLPHLPSGRYKIAVSAKPWYAQYAQSRASLPNSDGISKNGEPFEGNDPAASASPLDVSYPITFFADTTDSVRAEPIFVRPGERTAADLQLRAVPAIHLKFKGPPTALSLIQQIFDHAEQAFSGSGEEIPQVPPGHYLADLGSTKAEHTIFRQEQLDVAGDSEVDADSVPVTPEVSAVLTFADVPTKTQTLDLELFNPATGESRHGQPNEKGEVQFDDKLIRAGHYDVTLRSDSQYRIERITATGAKASGHSVEISGSESVRLTVALGSGFGRVDGVVLRNDKPFAGAMVVLVPGDPVSNYTLFRRDQSDSDGTFTLPDVLPGKYTVIAIADGWEVEWANPAVLKPYLSGGTTVAVGTSTAKIQVKAQPK